MQNNITNFKIETNKYFMNMLLENPDPDIKVLKFFYFYNNVLSRLESKVLYNIDFVNWN